MRAVAFLVIWLLLCAVTWTLESVCVAAASKCRINTRPEGVCDGWLRGSLLSPGEVICYRNEQNVILILYNGFTQMTNKLSSSLWPVITEPFREWWDVRCTLVELSGLYVCISLFPLRGEDGAYCTGHLCYWILLP